MDGQSYVVAQGDRGEDALMSRESYRLLKPTYPPKWSNIFFLVAHALTVCVGIAGLAGETAPSINAVLGYGDFATVLFALLFIFFGAIALFARVTKRLRVEATCVISIGGAFTIWGIIVLIAADGPVTTLQPAAGYFLVAALKMGWGMILFWWANSDLVVVPRLHLAEVKNARTTS